MLNKFKLFVYYLILYHLPNSRYGKVFNRIRVWYISSVLGILKKDGENYFENNVYISDFSQITIGAHCHINENVFIQGATIGNYVMIAPGVSILNSTHNYSKLDEPMVMQGEIKGLNPIIEDNVWVGRNVIILPGITIKEGSIIGAGAVVTKNIEVNSIVGGIPAKLIKMRV